MGLFLTFTFFSKTIFLSCSSFHVCLYYIIKMYENDDVTDTTFKACALTHLYFETLINNETYCKCKINE